MKDIMVHHDKVGVYSSWYTRGVDTWRGIMRQDRYNCGISPPNYPVPARIYHFDGDIVEPPNSVLSNGDISSIWWQVGSPNVMRFE